MADQIISQEYLHKIFNYKDGELFRISTQTQAGKRIDNDGYRRTWFNGKQHRTHRLIFAYHYGFLPKFIDHIDGDKTNNCIENLRNATISQNNQNAKIRKDNTSGSKNVYWEKRSKSWVVRITANKQEIHIGKYKNINDAILSAQKARNKYHGQFAKG